MPPTRKRISAVTSIFFALLMCASTSHAGNFYFSGQAGLSRETGSVTGTNTRLTEPVTLSGSDSDSSPIFGGTLGFEFPLNRALPWEIGLPRWMGESFVFPSWNIRAEIDGKYGRDSEFSTPGLSGITPYRTEVVSWSLMNNFWLDVPVHPPVEALFGRIPVLEHLSFYGGVGLGMAGNELETSDTIVTGKDTTYSFAWQAGAGFDYAITEWAHLDIGYRYVDLGEATVALQDGPLAAGSFTMDLTAHEFQTGLRFNFYSISFPDFRPR